MGLRVGEADALERRIGVALGLGVGRGADIGADDHVLQHGHAREGAHDLKGAADAEPADRMRLQADQVRSRKADAAGIGAEKSVDDVEQRRLAGAVRPDDAVDRAFRDGEA